MEHDEAHVSAAIDALERYQQQVTIAIILELPDRSALLGSGVLFMLSGRFFVITAAHLFEDLDGFENVRLPIGRYGERPVPIGVHKLTISDREPFDFDIAIIELLDTGISRSIQTEWQFLGLEQIALPAMDNIVCLGGFPEQLVTAGRTNNAKMLVVRSIISDQVPDGAKNVDVVFDIFGEYSPIGEIRVPKVTAETPKLQGVSGGSLMQYLPLPSGDDFWTASKTMRFIGIQSTGGDQRNWFRAKNWKAIALTFEKHDPELAAIVRAHLGI